MFMWPTDRYKLHCRVGKPPAGMHLDVSKNDKLVEVGKFLFISTLD